MPVAPTYPGVYIEEVSSGVRTLTGVSTSITAFVGYTARGPVNRGVRVQGFAEFERRFGGLDAESPLSYSVRDFFNNGGSDAVVVRVAQGALKASVKLLTAAGGVHVLTVEASSEGTWGNLLRLDVDYDTTNPADLFNLSVAELVDQSGALVVGRTERFTNLSMSTLAPGYVETAVNGVSELIRVTREANGTFTTGTSTSGVLALPDLANLDATHKRLAVSVDGKAPVEFNLFDAAVTDLFPTSPPATLDDGLDQLATRIAAMINQLLGATAVTATRVGSRVEVTSGTTEALDKRSSVRFFSAGTNDAARILKLGLANGGREAGGAAELRPMQTGTVGTPLANPLPAGTLALDVVRPSGRTTVNVTISSAASPPTLAEVLRALSTAFATKPELAGGTVSLVDGCLRLLPGPLDPNVYFEVDDAPAASPPAPGPGEGLGLNKGAASENVARYAPGNETALLASDGGKAGSNGTPPAMSDFQGSESAKTGIYALEDVDLFNLLCLPGMYDPAVLEPAVRYAERRRAFMLVELPPAVDTRDEAESWMRTTGAALRSRNAAAYFPQLREPDPLAGGVIRTFPPAGALAGVFARTDVERGVWKAPAGLDATVRGVSGLTATLTDRENGVLNPLGLNVLRTFPVYGTVVWGARTLAGADQLADEYKYVPVRRLALFLEESLYRGTQWVVFEPNDEPLWAQIRLNLGTFMHSLFRASAFQGRSPKEAYFVKCDRDTNPQADVDRGIVNVSVGFAPLKPAEFVIIHIQQIAQVLA